MASDTTVARLRFDTTVGLDGLKSGMRQANQVLKGSLGEMQSTMSRLGGFGGVAGKFGLSLPSGLSGALGGLANPGVLGIGAAAGLFGFSQKAASDAKEISHGARRIGFDTDAYQQLQTASRKSGVEMTAAETSVNRLRRAIAEGANGLKSTGSMGLKELGLDAAQLENLKPDKALEKVASALDGVKDGYQRVRIEAELFGKSGAELDPLLQKIGRGGLGQFHSALDLSQSQVSRLGAMSFVARLDKFANKAFAELFDAFAPSMPNKNLLEGAISPGKKTATADPAALSDLGGLAMYGSQAAYQASTANRFSIEERQLQVLEKIEANQAGGEPL